MKRIHTQTGYVQQSCYAMRNSETESQSVPEGEQQEHAVRWVPCKRYCQTLDLRDNPELVAEYRKRHQVTEIWPEVLEGIRQVGILEMEIYILGTRLFMIVETPPDFDWDASMARLATLPRQAEWEEYMAGFQAVCPGLTSAEKWKPMERMFHLYR